MASAIGDFCGTKGYFSSHHCLKLFNIGSFFSWRMALIFSKRSFFIFHFSFDLIDFGIHAHGV